MYDVVTSTSMCIYMNPYFTFNQSATIQLSGIL